MSDHKCSKEEKIGQIDERTKQLVSWPWLIGTLIVLILAGVGGGWGINETRANAEKEIVARVDSRLNKVEGEVLIQLKRQSDQLERLVEASRRP